MGILDRLESARLYRWVWDRDVFGRRPFTHSIRLLCGRWPGRLLAWAALFALGYLAGSHAPLSALALFALAYAFSLINGHLWV